MERLNTADLTAFLVEAARNLQDATTREDTAFEAVSVLLASAVARSWGMREFAQLSNEYGRFWEHPSEDLQRQYAALGHSFADLPVPSDFNLKAPSNLLEGQISHVLHMFDSLNLRRGNLAHDKVIGQAYDRFTDRHLTGRGKRFAESISTPEVTELLVRLGSPEPGDTVFDPFAGIGDRLVSARQFAEDMHGAGDQLSLFGQERIDAALDLMRLRMIIHAAPEVVSSPGDPLYRPLDQAGPGLPGRFDRIITVLPPSPSYNRYELKQPERMRYGWASERGTKADLMYLQYVLSALNPYGVGVIVAPQGVLYRGGRETPIRQGIVQDNRVAAVIGIGADGYQGSAVPSCVLVLRGPEASNEFHDEGIFFIDATRASTAVRTRTVLNPAVVQRITSAFQDQSEIPGFSRLVSQDELAARGWNLNIQHYIDVPESNRNPADARAILVGGIPKREVVSSASEFAPFELDPVDFFNVRDETYLDFPSDDPDTVTERIDNATERFARELEASERSVWEQVSEEIKARTGSRRLFAVRTDLMRLHREGLASFRILNGEELDDIFASWWAAAEDDLRTLDQLTAQEVPTPQRDTDGVDAAAVDGMLNRLGDELGDGVARAAAAKRSALSKRYRSWFERYGTSLTDLELRRNVAATELRAKLDQIGYKLPDE